LNHTRRCNGSYIGPASTVGLLGAALNSFIQNVKAAPKLAQSVMKEIANIKAYLSHLQCFIDGHQDMSGSAEQMLIVEQLVVALSNCVLIFSELERMMNELKLAQSIRADRLAKWMMQEPNLLKSSKLSLNLMLTTMSWLGISG